MLVPRFRPSPFFILFFCAGLLFLFVPGTVTAEGFQITPFMGYRAGGGFEDAVTGETLDLSEEGTYGLIIGMDMSPGKQYEFFYSFQPSRLTAGGVVTPVVLTDVDVEYFHIGGRNYWDRGAARTFITGGIGATHFDPHSSSLRSETRFSLSLGGGVELGASERVSLRMEGRGFATLFNSSGAIFCGSSSGCEVFISSDVLLQFEVGAGISLKL